MLQSKQSLEGHLVDASMLDHFGKPHQFCQAFIALLIVIALSPATTRAAAPQNSASKVTDTGRPQARVLLVGPTRKLKNPSAAARVAMPGDLIKIDAGTYRDCAIWRTPNIRIRGVGGYAHVKDVSCDGKAIWVFYAAPVHISNIRFSGARVPHRNGAGIRWEGHGRLALENSWIHNNQMGLLAHNSRKSRVLVRSTKFEANGDCPKFCGHGIYVGHLRYLSVWDSEFIGHRHGHHIKSRAYNTDIVGNRITDGSTGTASYSINIPDSGTATIRYNFIQKGPKTENAQALIAIGEEGPLNKSGRVNPSRGIIIEGNAFQNNNTQKTNFIWNRGPDPVTLRSNRFSGPGIKFRGRDKRAKQRR